MGSSHSDLILRLLLLLVVFNLRRVQGSAETLMEEVLDEMHGWRNPDAAEESNDKLSG